MAVAVAHKQLILDSVNEFSLPPSCEGGCQCAVMGSSHDDCGSCGLILAQCHGCENPQAQILQLNLSGDDLEWQSIPPMRDFHSCSSVITSGPFIFALNLGTALHEYDYQRRKWRLSSSAAVSVGNNLLQQYDTRTRSVWTRVAATEEIRDLKQVVSTGGGGLIAVFVKHLTWEYGHLHMRRYDAEEGVWSPRFGGVEVSLCLSLETPPLTLLNNGKLVMFRWYGGLSGHCSLSFWDEARRTWTEIDGEIPSRTCVHLYSIPASSSSVYAVCEDESVWKGDVTSWDEGEVTSKMMVRWKRVEVPRRLLEEGLASTPAKKQRLQQRHPRVEFVRFVSAAGV